jgi:hypothetical protein
MVLASLFACQREEVENTFLNCIKMVPPGSHTLSGGGGDVYYCSTYYKAVRVSVCWVVWVGGWRDRRARRARRVRRGAGVLFWTPLRQRPVLDAVAPASCLDLRVMSILGLRDDVVYWYLIQ